MAWAPVVSQAILITTFVIRSYARNLNPTQQAECRRPPWYFHGKSEPIFMTEAKYHVPSAYSSLETAGAAHGTRAQKYVDFLWRTDPLADAVMEEFARIPETEWRALLELALAKGIEAASNAPESLRALFRQLEDVPFWVDRERCNLGGATFMRCRLGFAVLAVNAGIYGVLLKRAVHARRRG